MSLLDKFAGAMKDALNEDEATDRSVRGADKLASHVSGRKKALFVGINYTGTKAELRGCINDVKNISNFLFQRYGFRAENSIFLTDDQSDPNRLPTKSNIISAMKWLVRGAAPGDSLFFHFSGHGASVDDKDGDEIDGKDEVLVPLDYATAGMLLDDDVNQILVKAVPEGVRLTCILDCCHSGTLLDNPYSYTVDGHLDIHETQGKPSRVRKGFSKIKEGVQDITSGDVFGGLSDLKSGIKYLSGRRGSQSDGESAPAPAPTPQQLAKASVADVIAFSGCRDDQTSADAHISGSFTGAMSYALIKTLTENPNVTYTELLKHMRQTLRGKYTQVPQMTSGRHLDLNTKFHL